MGTWEGLKWYRELCGIRGLAAIASYRLFTKPVELAVVPPGRSHSVYLRIDTSDLCAYRDVLVFKTKSYEPQIADFAPKTIVDVGAHIGMASILFAVRYPTARIIAVEPEGSNFALLLRNIAPYKTIKPIRAAIWTEDGDVFLGPSNAHPKGAFQIVDGGQCRVRALTMSTLLNETGIDSVDLLKMDIEGSEKDVFASCPWLSNVRVLAIELHDRIRPGCSSTVKAAARNFRYHQNGEVSFFVREQDAWVDHYQTDSFAAASVSPHLPAA